MRPTATTACTGWTSPRLPAAPGRIFTVRCPKRSSCSPATCGSTTAPTGTADRTSAGLASVSELLLYSAGDQSLGALSQAAGALLGDGGSRNVPPDVLPIVLFIWGPGRVLPVRITGLTVKELEFDWLLNPARAEVDLSLEVLKRLPSDSPARGVYDYTERQMRAVARLQLVNDVQSVISSIGGI